jgi:uncharacterized protein
MRLPMPLFVPGLFAFSLYAAALEPEYVDSVQQWRDKAENSLRADNGWLTLAGRYVMNPGVNRVGTAKDNDIVFPPGAGPQHLGSLTVEPGKVTLKTADGITMTAGGVPFTGTREMKTNLDKRDWVSLGRMSMHVIEREGKYILRLADNESEVRKKFIGRVWYEVKEPFRVEARFVPYPPGRTVSIVNVIDEVSDEPSPGYVEFKIDGQTQRLDAVSDEGGLFFVFRDLTAGDTTYPPGRFLDVLEMHKPGQVFMLDFNKAYNPPCAFSDYTTCPLPPDQNKLKVRVEAGEKYAKH